MKLEQFYPSDLGHIQDKAISIKHDFEVWRSSERSEEIRAKHIDSAENKIDVIIRDIDYLFDTKLFNGKRAIGLDEDNQ